MLPLDPRQPAARALVVGHFAQLHQGHQFLFAFAQIQAKNLVIATLPGADVKALMNLTPSAQIISLRDDSLDALKASLAAASLATPELFVSAKQSDRALATALGSSFVIAEQITANPLTPLPSPQKALTKRICLFGPESTGKSRMASDLAAHFKTRHVSEYLRTYAESIQRPLEPQDSAWVMRGQLAAEAAMTPLAQGLLFCDTDPLTTVIYADFYFGSCPPALREAAAQCFYDLTLCLDTDVPWVFDPLRDRPHHRTELRTAFRQALEETGRNTVFISGPWQARWRQALEAVETLKGS